MQARARAKPDKAKPCPICGKHANDPSQPFCSEPCREVDLNRWLSGSYAIPGKEDDDERGESARRPFAPLISPDMPGILTAQRPESTGEKTRREGPMPNRRRFLGAAAAARA